jgi:MSHA biogenesis protein MshJ
LVITPREQYLVLLTGLAAVVFIVHHFFIDESTIKIDKLEKQIMQLSNANLTSKASITVFEEALLKDPNTALNRQISQYKAKLKKVDVNLLKLTSDLIDPIQMRYALLKLLKTQKGVYLQSFQVVAAQPVNLSSEVT